MLYVRFYITISGTNFQPDCVVDKLNTSLVVEDIVTDYSFGDNWNMMQLFHKNEFSKEYYDDEYEREFVDFFKNNYELLKKYGAEDFTLMMDIYCCDQCNFEIFDKDKLPELAKGDVSLPISVYYLEPDNYYSDLYYKLNPDLEYGERL